MRECPYTRVASPEPLIESPTTHSSDSTSSSTDTSSTNSSPPHSLVSDKSTLKTATLTHVDLVPFPTSIKDKISQSSSNINNFVVRPRTGEDQEEASISGGMPILQATGPLVEEGQSPTPAIDGVDTSNLTHVPVDPREAERAEAAYQEEVISYTDTEKASADVDFDDMVSDRPSLFCRVAITTKTKPGASMVPESTSTTPQATGSNPPQTTIPLAKIPSMLKRLAGEPPASNSQPTKRAKVPAPKKKTPQVSTRGSGEETTRSVGGESQMFLMPQHSVRPQAPVVELDSSTTFLTIMKSVTPFLWTPTFVLLPRMKESQMRPRLPNLEVTREAPWNTRRFHFHVVKPLLNKKVTARYAPLKEPFAVFPQSAKHMNEALNDAYVLARRSDYLNHENHSATKRIEVLRKVIATKNNLFDGAKEDDSSTPKREGGGLGFCAAEAKAARAEYAKKIIHGFLRSPTYLKKVGRECAVYLTHVFTHRKEEFPDLVRNCEVEQDTCPFWYEGLSLDPPATDEDEGVVDSLGDVNIELPPDGEDGATPEL
ncbi:hypothetical protein LIER_15506 [Lithospermum erythrorhizon]|uniref:Uncharacterized protein n=1 Tax=Lithospermum erythrorhizon TaxID=34254 RepID=A0AAV3Q4P6_LITER